mmetsp:Transcript_14509/g.22518  ORF Transcript_14509/g.22518 Transcript_14509/m.22518 type:complete len:114 (-) Transcript_14509:163-504(-)
MLREWRFDRLQVVLRLINLLLSFNPGLLVSSQEELFDVVDSVLVSSRHSITHPGRRRTLVKGHLRQISMGVICRVSKTQSFRILILKSKGRLPSLFPGAFDDLSFLQHFKTVH